MEYKFHKADHGFCNEVVGFKSKVDYSSEFFLLSPNVINDLKDEVDFYYHLLVDGNLSTAVIDITNRNISNIKFEIDLYLYESSSNYSRLGFQVFMKDTNTILQHLSFTAPFNTNNFEICPQQIDVFKEYLFSCLFYVYIFCNKFRFHPMLVFFYHCDDISKLSDIKSRRYRLFGDEDNECSVCFESTVTTTACNHSLCNSCFAKLRVKVCPLCRAMLETQFIITNLLNPPAFMARDEEEHHQMEEDDE